MWMSPSESDIARIIQSAEPKCLTYKLLAGLAATVVIAVAWAWRWEVTSITDGAGMGSAYMLNRWTGSMYYVKIDERVVVPTAK